MEMEKTIYKTYTVTDIGLLFVILCSAGNIIFVLGMLLHYLFIA